MKELNKLVKQLNELSEIEITQCNLMFFYRFRTSDKYCIVSSNNSGCIVSFHKHYEGRNIRILPDDLQIKDLYKINKSSDYNLLKDQILYFLLGKK